MRQIGNLIYICSNPIIVKNSFLSQKYLDYKLDVYGYEFLLNGKSIGAVQTVNNGRVWIDSSQSDDVKLALASVATGVLLRHNPKELQD